MKRLLTVLVPLLCLVPVAQAAMPTADVSFNGSYKHKRPVEVTDFTYYSVAMDCEEGATTASNSGSPLSSMSVSSKGKFKGKFSADGIKTVVKGKYAKDLSKVSGTLQIKGDYAGYTKCDSGKQKWVTN
jgi:hypothetical protein